MDTSQKNPQEIPSHLEQKKLIEFLESLHRIFKIGIYYPAGHKVLDQAAEQFQRNISGIADTNRSVLIELQNETLLVEGYEISTLTNALREFKKLILDLGIGTIEIDRSIILPELLQFVRSLLLGRSQLQGVKEFTQAEIDNLPQSIRISQKVFFVDKTAILLDVNDEDAEHGLDTVFQFLAKRGLDSNKIEQCKKFLNNLTVNFSSKPLNVKELPTVSWSDVRSLLIKVVSNAYHLTGDSGKEYVQNELNDISSIFQGLQKELKDTDSQETINLLVSAFGSDSFNKKKLDVEPDKKKEIRRAENISVQSIQELQTFINDNFVPLTTFAKINQIDRREELGILIQLLQWKQEPAVEDKIRKNLRDILTTLLTVVEMETLIKGILYLATRVDSSRFFDIIHFFVIIFRNTKNFSSQKFLVMICKNITPEAKTGLWPIIVNEILSSGQTDRKAFTELISMATVLSGNEMKIRWSELELMDCFQEKQITTDFFDPKLQSAFPLFSFLLETTLKKQIGARILSCFMTSPPDWLIEAVAPLLQLSIPQHMKFLQIYLLLAQQEHITPNILIAAGTLIVHQLPEISEQQMSEPWVVKTIQATPEMQVEETRSLLQHIIKEKRKYIIPKWPSACRRAAAIALDQLRRKPL